MDEMIESGLESNQVIRLHANDMRLNKFTFSYNNNHKKSMLNIGNRLILLS